MTETEEEFEKRKKQIEANEKFEFNVKVGKANPVSKNTEGIVVKDVDIPFSSALSLTVKFFFAGLIVALPIWFIVFIVVGAWRDYSHISHQSPSQTTQDLWKRT